MKTKNLIILLVFTVICETISAQDLIVTKDAKKIEVKVTEINIYDIKYKLFNNLDGPVYTMLKKDISSVIYKNGTIELFDNASEEKLSEMNNFDKNEFLKLNDDEQEDFLKQYDTELYEKFKQGQDMSYRGKYLRNGGIVISVIGAAAMIGGYASLFNNAINGRYDNKDVILFTLGCVAGVAGEVLIIASIPNSAVGGAIKRKVQNEYQEKYLGTTKPERRFQFQLSGNGVGLAYVF